MTTGAQPTPTTGGVRRPRLSDVDVFGVTDAGHVRPVNADHFLVASFHRAMKVHATSIEGSVGPTESQARGVFLLVADGVGSHTSAGDGSAHALKTVVHHLLNATEVCSELAEASADEVVGQLRAAVLAAHKELRDAGAEALAAAEATTLTMLAIFWPRAFVMHAGDSRCYRLRDGRLERLTSDQTMAQVLVDAGALTPEAAEQSRLRHVLWSAVGAKDVQPEVRVDDWDARDVMLLCTDGLTKHVTDDELRDHLARATSAEETCRALLALALERGGTDNVSLVVGRVKR